jgi:hypothetical protein
MGHFVFATACAVYASKLLPYVQQTLAMGYHMGSICYQIATAFAAYGSKAQNICQFVTVCAVYASKLLPYAQHILAKLLQYVKHTLGICHRNRSVR